MSDSLPDRPNLDQLRRRAKELRDAVRGQEPEAVERFGRHHESTPDGGVTLAVAQLVIARELGFASWPRLKAAIERLATVPERVVEAFITASIEGHMREASAILESDPEVTSRNLAAAAVYGDIAHAAHLLDVDPAAALAVDEIRGWPPLLYAAYSHWQRVDPLRAVGVTEVIRLLLEAGASPNTNDGARYPHSALKGSVEANNSESTKLLLEAGANPDVGQPIGEAIGRGDHRCLELLLAHGARVARTWAIGSAVFHDDPSAVGLLIRTLDAEQAAAEASESIPDAAKGASTDVMRALLDGGGDPNVCDEKGVSALRVALQAGSYETADLLASRGAFDDSTELDRFIGLCRQGNRSAAETLLTQHPDLRERLAYDNGDAIFDAADSDSGTAVGLMLEMGFSPHLRNHFGEQPLHSAAHAGNAEAVRFLLDAGAEVDARDGRFEATPLTFATVGSGAKAGEPGNWIEVIRLLIGAGASREGVWIADMAPSEEVIDLLRSYGIGPKDETKPAPVDADEPPTSLGAGVEADIARHLAAAYRSLDLDLLGSLLHPDVRWSGNCNSSAEVLDWYRRLMADGTRAVVESVEVDRDAVVMGVRVTGSPEGVRPAPAELLFQVFTISEGEIVEIRIYPDRSSAHARARS